MNQGADFQQPPSEQPYLGASSADRQATIDVLDRGLALGRLTAAEHAERVAKAQQARTRPELNVLTADLVIVQDSHHADEVAQRPGGIATVPATYNSGAIGAYLSTRQRQGTWVVPPCLTLNNVMGTIKLDLRNAVFESLDVNIEISCVMGDVKIWLPEGIQVVDETRCVLSDVKLKKLSRALPGHPRIVFTGVLIMGNLIVYGSDYVSLADRIKGIQPT